MNLNDNGFDRSDEGIFIFEVSDAELESAAGPAALPLGALSFPNAPTVSILVVCCSNDSSAQG